MKPMDAEDWQRLAPLLDAAFELEPGERAAFVDRELADDQRLAGLLHELIAAESEAGAFLELPVELDGEGDDDAPYPDVDGYTIVRPLGRGGMGVVYEATRRLDDVEQRVALKVVRPDLDGDVLRARFARERTILAALEHPNVARLLDGGRTREGRSFFAMEYVDGTPITAYADRERLTIDARLALFEQTCAAVAFAQQRLVVHRDIKPSNVLVDVEGRVKLLDFGIARVIESEGSASDATLTRDGARLLTPEYAAPEQIHGERATTATDVYALGVVLFELLAGRHPYADSRESAFEFAYSDRDSIWLPRAVDASTGAEVGRARRTGLTALRRTLGGDLASVTAKALQRDPSRRYASAAQLLDDLRAYREGRPVVARAPSWRYRASKAVARNRAAFVAGALAILALVAGTAVATWQADVARREATRSERTVDFLVRMFEDTHPDRARGADWTATELLARGADRLELTLADDPAVRARLERTLGTIQLDRGDYASARTLLERALEYEHVDDPMGIRLALARVEIMRGASSVAESILTSVDEAALTPRQRGDYLESYASLRRQTGSAAAAESLSRVALEISADLHGERSAAYADDLDNLSVPMAELGLQEEAAELQRRALEIRREVLPSPHSDLALGLHNHASTLSDLSRHDEATALFDEAIAMMRELYPEGHMVLARSLRVYGQVLTRLDRFDEAEAMIDEALAMTKAELGERNEDVALCVNDLAILAYYRGDQPLARDRFAQALDLYRTEQGPAHRSTLGIARNLAMLQSVTGQIDEAARTLEDVVAQFRSQFGDESPDVAFSMNALGIVVRRQGRIDEAVRLHRGARDRFVAIHGDAHPMVSMSRALLAHALRESGQAEQALSEARAAVEWSREHLPAGDRYRADAEFAFGAALVAVGRADEARTPLESAEAALLALNGEGSNRVASVRVALGRCLFALGERETGRTLVTGAIDDFESADVVDARELRMAREALAVIDGR